MDGLYCSIVHVKVLLDVVKFVVNYIQLVIVQLNCNISYNIQFSCHLQLNCNISYNLQDLFLICKL